MWDVIVTVVPTEISLQRMVLDSRNDVIVQAHHIKLNEARKILATRSPHWPAAQTALVTFGQGSLGAKKGGSKSRMVWQ